MEKFFRYCKSYIGSGVIEELEQFAHNVPGLSRVPKWLASIDPVRVPTPDPLLGDVAGLLQVRDDPLDGTLGDTGLLGEVPQARVRCACEEKEDATVIGQQRPRARGRCHGPIVPQRWGCCP